MLQCAVSSRLGENVTLQKRDWHEAIDFYAEPGPDAVELGRFADSPANMRESQLEQVRAFVHARNRWPEEPAGFRRHAEGYFAEMRRVGDGLMDVAGPHNTVRHSAQGCSRTFPQLRRWRSPSACLPPISAASQAAASGAHA